MKSAKDKAILIILVLILSFSFLVYTSPVKSQDYGFSTYLPLIMKNQVSSDYDIEDIFEAIYAAGHNHVWSETDFWTQEQQNDLWMRMESAILVEAEKIVDYVVTNYIHYAPDYIGHSEEEVLANEGLQVTLGIVLWGFGNVNSNGELVTGCTLTTFDLVTSFPTHEDFTNEILSCYDWDIEEAFPYESPDGTDVYNKVKLAFIQYWESI